MSALQVSHEPQVQRGSGRADQNCMVCRQADTRETVLWLVSMGACFSRSPSGACLRAALFTSLRVFVF